MKFNNINELTLFEHRFWLQILGDHSRFILNSLSPKETVLIHQANQFINLFDDLLKKSHGQISDEDIHELNREAYSAAMEIRKLKLSILTRQIDGKIDIHLPPTFINHMVNELDEYIFILNALIIGKVPTVWDIHLHLLWLPDGAGHASSIVSNLDMSEKDLIKKGREYSKTFDDLYLKTIEYNGYTRTGIHDFPALKKLNTDAYEIMVYFKNFLGELEESILDKKVLGTLSPLITDHMDREECYYLTKLSMVSDTKDPECDPGKPRIEL